MATLFQTLRADYESAVADGLISTRKHPVYDLWVHNYTHKAMVTTGAWRNSAVRVCRGLITDDNDRTVSRPFEKFFNYNQIEASPINRTAPAQVYDKLDGSLGILYPVPGGGHGIASRGSFTSEQAIHACQVWADNYAGRWAPHSGYTFLFEIIYPDNRIVVDYGGLDDLVLLGAVNNRTGGLFNPEIWDWPGPVAEALPYTSLAEALKAEPRENREGMVLRFDNGKMVKVKQDDYIVLHRAVTGLNERRVWEWLTEHDTTIGLVQALPDEFRFWIRGVEKELREKARRIETRAIQDFKTIMGRLVMAGGWPAYTGDNRADRKAFALEAKKTQYPGYLFMLLDDKDIRPAIWESLKPNAAPYSATPREESEDAA